MLSQKNNLVSGGHFLEDYVYAVNRKKRLRTRIILGVFRIIGNILRSLSEWVETGKVEWEDN